MPLPHYIVVEGPIGVGKTTLVAALAERLRARTVFELFEENPFLADFYRDRARYALPTEMYFLLNRFKQQDLFAQEDLLQRHAVSDYLFDKCRLFAEVTLGPLELAVFRQTYAILSRNVPTPDAVVHLHAPVRVLVDRIAQRGRDFEAQIHASYLAALDQRYWRLFADYTAAPVVSVDTTGVDFRRSRPVDKLVELLSAGARGPLDPSLLNGHRQDRLEL